jgi:ketosteroid isomerase-like protein
VAGAQIVRTPLRPLGRSRRTLDQRLALRFPAPFAAFARVIGVLSPRSRLRRASLTRTARVGLDCYNRRDLEAAVALCHRDFEYRPGRAWVQAGLVEASYRGLEGYRRYIATVDEVWGGHNYLRPIEFVDAGECVLVLAQGSMRAQASGVPLSEAFALLTTLKDGRPQLMQEYYDHGEALAELGLQADAGAPAGGQ